MPTTKLVCYGIKNCDTMKKALLWLEHHKLAYEFVDYKQAGIVDAHLAELASNGHVMRRDGRIAGRMLTPAGRAEHGAMLAGYVIGMCYAMSVEKQAAAIEVMLRLRELNEL